MSLPKSFQPIRAALIDLDGTLVDSLADLHQAVNHVLGLYGRAPLDRDTVRGYIGDGVRVLLARSFLGWDETELESEDFQTSKTMPTREALDRREASRQTAMRQLLERAAKLSDPSLKDGIEAFRVFYGEHLVDNTRCYPGVIETLEQLRSQGVVCAVVSNKPEGFTKTIVSRLKIAPFFADITGGDTVPHAKPHPDPAIRALDKIGAHPQETIFVGDCVNDIICGQSSGCRTAMVTYGLSSSALLEAYKPDFKLRRFSDLADIVLC